jgi:hypothetical protein
MLKIFKGESSNSEQVTRIDDFATIYLTYKLGDFSSEKTPHSMWELIAKLPPIKKPESNELLASPTYCPPYLCNLVNEHLVKWNLAGFIASKCYFIPRKAEFEYSVSVDYKRWVKDDDKGW